MVDFTDPMILDVIFFVIFSQLNLWLLIQLDTFLELLESNSTKISQYDKENNNNN